jgi:hypothetical protein
MAVAPVLLLLCVFLCGFLAPGQKPARTLKDAERGTAVDLYEVMMAEDDPPFLLHVNERFGYSVLIPPVMAEKVVIIPDNGDGLTLTSKDGKARFRGSGGRAEFVEGGLKGTFMRALDSAGPDVSQAILSNNEYATEWMLFWRQGDMIYKRKFAIHGGNVFDCELSYPASEQEKYDSVTNTVVVNSGFLPADTGEVQP